MLAGRTGKFGNLPPEILQRIASHLRRSQIGSLSLVNTHFFRAMSGLLSLLRIDARKANVSLAVFLPAVQLTGLGTTRRRVRSRVCLVCGVKDGNDYVPEPLLCRIDIGGRRSGSREFEILPLETLAVELDVPMHVLEDVEYKFTNPYWSDTVFAFRTHARRLLSSPHHTAKIADYRRRVSNAARECLDAGLRLTSDTNHRFQLRWSRVPNASERALVLHARKKFKKRLADVMSWRRVHNAPLETTVPEDPFQAELDAEAPTKEHLLALTDDAVAGRPPVPPVPIPEPPNHLRDVEKKFVWSQVEYTALREVYNHRKVQPPSKLDVIVLRRSSRNRRAAARGEGDAGGGVGHAEWSVGGGGVGAGNTAGS
ncbi:hypothetical protein M427DRAFT_451908 [Gonapodya prolifera JEL478]|uniref:F-box domain-containing protein n=1 Tax=Gonapodya prolifera (strain JEL478) TaxID=1344416 RepID=A0A139AS74_GONPJ|nr:hypothetical protein M427DRAFT_451908 [Gonapodya prolifera JEL478]|eukprot:KXS19504.1 hypothetical protein M427DRAFT_451908 [Gonapodya prolifera JEL478]